MENTYPNHLVKKGGIMKLPGDYKRNYRFRSDTSKEQKYLSILIAVVIIAAIILYFI